MIIYEGDETYFNTNGLGYLNDVLSASVVDELNGDYYLTFTYPINAKMANYLIENNIVKCKVADGSMQLFTITNVVKTFDTLTITAKHIFYNLLFNLVEDVYPQNLNGQNFLRWILDRTNYNTRFTGYSDISTLGTARYVRKNPVECILGADNSMVNIFGGELKRDNFDIYFNSRIGNDLGLKLMFAKNITGINITIDSTECFTRILPLGYNGLILPEKYIDSPFINQYPYPRIAVFKFDDIKYDPEDEEAYHTEEEAYQALRDKVQEMFEAGVDKPQTNIKVDWLELSKTEEYKQYSALETVHLGDTIQAVILGLIYKTRVIKTTYNPLTDMIEKFEIGTLQQTIGDSINTFERIVETINPSSILDQARDNATALITSAMGGYIYKTQNELYIMDTDDPNTAQRVWRWNINGLGYSSTGINGPYGLAMTMDGSIVADFITTGTLSTNVIEGYDSLVIQVVDNSQKYNILTQTVAELNSKIGDVLDISTSGESQEGWLVLENINASQPMTVQIHPINSDLTNLYPRNDLYPGASLYPHSSVLRFTNLETNEIFEYSLPTDLLWLDSETYDEFYMAYDEEVCQVIRRVGIDSHGNRYKLTNEVIKPYTYPGINLTTGTSYRIELLGVTQGYLFCRLMASNIYTSQFATHSEVSQTASSILSTVETEYATKDLMRSSIQQTADEINLEVSKKVGDNEIISKINQSAEAIQIQANKVSLAGKTIALTSDNININSNNFRVDNYGNITASNANISGTINASSGSFTGSVNATSGTFNGTVYASSGSFNGSIYSSSGTIGGLTISGGGLSNSRAAINGSDGIIQCYNSSGGSMILSNAARLSATAGIGISSNSTGNVSAPARNIDIKACSGASVYIGSMSNASGTSENNAITVTYSQIIMTRNPTIVSDIRKKKNIKDIKVDWIDELKVKEFDYKKGNDSKNIGLIAQDYLDKEYNKYFLQQDEEGYYGINYGNITNALIQYCQELKNEINTLKEEIKILKEEK